MDPNTFATSRAGRASRRGLLLGRQNVARGRGSCGRVAGVGGVALAAASQVITTRLFANFRRRPRLVRSLTSNYAFQPTVVQRGPRLSAARASWPAVELGR
jgi:hypothetical protein